MVYEQNASYNNGSTGQHHTQQQQPQSQQHHGKANGNVVIYHHHGAGSISINHDDHAHHYTAEPQSTLVQIETDDHGQPYRQLPLEKVVVVPKGAHHTKQPVKGILKNSKMAAAAAAAMVRVPTVVEVAPTPTDTTTESTPSTSRPSSGRQPKMGILKNQFYSNHVRSVFEDTQDDPNEIVELHDDDDDDESIHPSQVPNILHAHHQQQQHQQPQHVSLDMSPVTSNDSAKPHTTTTTNTHTNEPTSTRKSDKVCDTPTASMLTANGSVPGIGPLAEAAPPPPPTPTTKPISRWAMLGSGAKASSPPSASSSSVVMGASLLKTSATVRPAPQQLSVNHLQVPSSGPSLPSAAGGVTLGSMKQHQSPQSSSSSRPSSSLHSLPGPSVSLLTQLSTTSQGQQQQQQSSYPAITTQRMSDLRKILNPEVEKEDSFKKLSETIENCDCFEFNLNNAAKIITVLVLFATLVMVIKALKGDR